MMETNRIRSPRVPDVLQTKAEAGERFSPPFAEEAGGPARRALAHRGEDDPSSTARPFTSETFRHENAVSKKGCTMHDGAPFGRTLGEAVGAQAEAADLKVRERNRLMAQAVLTGIL